MAYSEITDLLTGNVPTPAYLSPQKYVDDAADEIDSKIGFVYETPIDVTDSSSNPVSRPVRLLLKRINNFLASGRLLLAVDAGAETDRVHSYGLYLIQEAQMSLDLISSGKIDLEGAEVLPAEQATVTAPLIHNVDEESNVESFYDRIANPNFVYFPLYVPGIPGNPDGLIR